MILENPCTSLVSVYYVRAYGQGLTVTSPVDFAVAGAMHSPGLSVSSTGVIVVMIGGAGGGGCLRPVGPPVIIVNTRMNGISKCM